MKLLQIALFTLLANNIAPSAPKQEYIPNNKSIIQPQKNINQFDGI